MNNLLPDFIIFLISMSPVVELRGAIPIGYYVFKRDIFEVLSVCV